MSDGPLDEEGREERIENYEAVRRRWLAVAGVIVAVCVPAGAYLVLQDSTALTVLGGGLVGLAGYVALLTARAEQRYRKDRRLSA